MSERTTDTQHLFSPANLYKTKLERRFRNLRCVTVKIDYYVHHHVINALNGHLPKPTPEMIQAVVDRHDRKECSCYRR